MIGEFFLLQSVLILFVYLFLSNSIYSESKDGENQVENVTFNPGDVILEYVEQTNEQSYRYGRKNSFLQILPVQMELRHQEVIQKNFVELINRANTTSLLQNLSTKSVFSDGTFEALQNLRGKNQTRQFFLDVQKRGPEAFKNLIKALVETRQRSLAELLDPAKEFVEEEIRVSRNGGTVPFQLPEFRNGFSETDPNYYQNDNTPLKVVVIPSEDFLHDEPSNNRVPVYFTRNRKRGLVKIINMFQVHGHNMRHGSEHDVRNLKDLFEQIGMRVDVLQDSTKEEIEKSLRVFVRSEELKFCDIAVIVIMSHGGKNSANKEYFLDVNGNAILTSEVENLFSNRNCPYMQKKPKIIAYQLCRGRINDKGITPGADDIVFNNFSHDFPISKIESDGAPEKICESSDLLIIHSTIPEYTANRDIYTGSWFIQLLCKVFMTYACNMDVESMLKLIKEEMQRLRSAQGVMQTMEYTNRSFNLCFLNPGIFIEDDELHFFK